MGSLIPYHDDAGIFIKVIFLVLAAVIDEQILFLIDQLQDVPSACLKIRC
jgi:hypothetical protein